MCVKLLEKRNRAQLKDACKYVNNYYKPCQNVSSIRITRGQEYTHINYYKTDYVRPEDELLPSEIVGSGNDLHNKRRAAGEGQL